MQSAPICINVKLWTVKISHKMIASCAFMCILKFSVSKIEAPLIKIIWFTIYGTNFNFLYNEMAELHNTKVGHWCKWAPYAWKLTWRYMLATGNKFKVSHLLQTLSLLLESRQPTRLDTKVSSWLFLRFCRPGTSFNRRWQPLVSPNAPWQTDTTHNEINKYR